MKFLTAAVLLAFLAATHLPLGAAPRPAPAKCRTESLLARDEFPPPPEGDRGFDVLSYDLDIRLDPTSSSINGQVAIGLASLAPGLTSVQLDLVQELTCDEVTAQGQPLDFTHQGDALVIQLAQPWTPGAADTLTVSWSGRPPRHGQMLVGLLFRHHNAGTVDDPDDDVPIIANLSQPWSAHSWWPCKDHPADKALVSAAVTVPDTLSVVSNGTLLGVDDLEPGWRRYRWREAYPLATYLVGVAASNYVSWQEECLAGPEMVPLQYHVFPQDRARAEHDFAPTCAMLEFMTDLAGPYPFAGEKYAQVEIKWIGAMEHTTATSISQLLLTGDGRYETLILHELAHHWFGDSLTPGAWRDIWLSEGFARYCEALWVEHSLGGQAYVDFMKSIGQQRHDDFFAGQGLLGDPDPILPNLLVYDKGAWLLHSLRQLMGDEAFFGFLAAYARDPDLVQGTVSRQQFCAALEEFVGHPLDSFLDPWLDTAEVPLVWWETRHMPEGVAITFHQEQAQVFTMAMPVRLETSCGTREEVYRLSSRNQTVVWQGCPVQSVSVDPDSTVFMFRGQAPPPPLSVGGPAPNPVTAERADFELFLTQDSQVLAKMFDTRGRLIEEFDLGRVENTGPASDPQSVPLTWTLWPGQLEPRPAAGVYWLEFRAGNSRAVRKLTLLH
jgi:aminopeptidase N